MEIVERQFNDKDGNPVFRTEVADTASRAEIGGKVYRRKMKDGEFESEDFFETDEQPAMKSLSRPRLNVSA